MFEEKLKKYDFQFPVNPYIIGKNKNFSMKTSSGTAEF